MVQPSTACIDNVYKSLDVHGNVVYLLWLHLLSLIESLSVKIVVTS